MGGRIDRARLTARSHRSLAASLDASLGRLGMERVAPHKELVAVDADAFELLWVGTRSGESGPTPTLALDIR